MKDNKFDMEQVKQRKQQSPIKFPQIKQKSPWMVQSNGNKNLRLQKIGKKSNIAVLNLMQIHKIQKQFSVMTQKHPQQDKKIQKNEQQMRQSKLLLLKNIKQPTKKSNNQNLLSNMVIFDKLAKPLKIANIPISNISISPSKIRNPKSKQKIYQLKNEGQVKLNSLQNHKYIHYQTVKYQNPTLLLKIDFVKMFIVEELFYYISHSKERSKEEMAGFCKFYNDNSEISTYAEISQVLIKSNEYLHSVFYEKIGFYIFLILGTDSGLKNQSSFLLNSLTGYIHTNNMILLDLMMEIIDNEKFEISSQFHVFNTSRFNEGRREIKYDSDDKMSLLAKNNDQIMGIIRGILKGCVFQSLKNFVLDIINNDDIEILQKIKQVCLMLVSLESILNSSLEKEKLQEKTNKPKPPFLPQKTKNLDYTLVLDMDETLIHYVQRQDNPNGENNAFLIRPYCLQFLSTLSQFYEIVIFTAAVKEYADLVLDLLDKNKFISHRLYREHTRIQDYVSIKDLSLINRDLSKTIIVDNIQSNFKLQPRNGIAISTWIGDPQDRSLLNLIPVLKKISTEGVSDVRDSLQFISKYMEESIEKGNQIEFDKISLKGL